MQISGSSQPQPQPARTEARAAGAAAQPTMGGDLRVITYNTAVGNPKIKTKQEDFTKLPFYQDVITGQPDAPILCLQEVGKKQLESLEAYAAKTGNFTVKGTWVNGNQYDAIVVPKRFEMQAYEDKRFGLPQVKAALSGFKSWLGKLKKPSLNDLLHPIKYLQANNVNSLSQLTEPRAYQHAKLKDTTTGKTFDLFNSHISFQNPTRDAQAKVLFDAANDVKGPVIVAGDLNTRTKEDGASAADLKTAEIWKGFQDMGPVGPAADKSNIDYVLAKGFESVDSHVYSGNELSLPGSPDAKTVSDHYAEEDLLRFKD